MTAGCLSRRSFLVRPVIVAGFVVGLRDCAGANRPRHQSARERRWRYAARTGLGRRLTSRRTGQGDCRRKRRSFRRGGLCVPARGRHGPLLPAPSSCGTAVFLPSHLRLRGSGADTVITKIGSETVALADDSDWYDQEITLAAAGGFQVGDGVVLRATNPHHGGATVIKRTLVARSGNRFKLNDGLRENLWVSGNPTCASLFPLLTSERTEDVVIEDLTLDGNRTQNENLDGNYGGCIFLQDCNRYTIRRVEARNYNGDGISFQICHDVVVEACYSHDHAGLGVHPGSGSQRPRRLATGSTVTRSGCSGAGVSSSDWPNGTKSTRTAATASRSATTTRTM